jgi:hypothetical protein
MPQLWRLDFRQPWRHISFFDSKPAPTNLDAKAVSWEKQDTKSNAVHFLNINFHFDLSWFIRFLRSLAAGSPLRLEMSAIVLCHHADALALPSSLIFCWYLKIHSLASLWRISCKEKRIVNCGSADGLSIFYPV